MAENPYEAPADEATGVLSGKRDDVLEIAKYQKGIILCIVANFVIYVGSGASPPDLRIFLLVALVIVGLISAGLVVLLCLKVYSTAAGILMGLLSLVPCIGLIVLLIVNTRAPQILQDNGFKVGLLGART